MLKTTKNIRNLHLPPPEISILLEGSGVVVQPWSYVRDFPFWVLYFNRTEGACVRFGERTVPLNAERLLLIPPHTRFCSHCDGPFQHQFLHFLAGYPYSGTTPGEMLLPSAPYQKLLDCLESGDPEYMRHAAYALICCVLLEIPKPRYEGNSGGIDRRIQTALPLLERRRPATEIARRVGMSLSNFEHLFRLQMRLSPGRYAAALRLERARWMLENTGMPIGKIARNVGFADRFSFSKAFLKYAGIAPGRLRGARRGAPPEEHAGEE